MKLAAHARGKQLLVGRSQWWKQRMNENFLDQDEREESAQMKEKRVEEETRIK